MIITIDGPSASGKSTIASLLARQTKSFYINSGLLFRALAFSILEEKRDASTLLHDQSALDEYIKKSLDYTFTPETGVTLYHRGRVITPFLKSPEVTSYSSVIATEPVVRQALLTYQRALAKNRNVIADGRDCGTVVFPEATFKFFITADETIRAQRLQKDLASHNKFLSLEEATFLIHERDSRDAARLHAPLKQSPDAYCIDTSTLSIEETLDCVVTHLHS